MEFQIRLADDGFTVWAGVGEQSIKVAEADYGTAVVFHFGDDVFIAGVLGPGPTDRTVFLDAPEGEQQIPAGVYKMKQEGCTIVDDADNPPIDPVDGICDGEYEDDSWDDEEEEQEDPWDDEEEEEALYEEDGELS